MLTDTAGKYMPDSGDVLLSCFRFSESGVTAGSRPSTTQRIATEALRLMRCTHLDKDIKAWIEGKRYTSKVEVGGIFKKQKTIAPNGWINRPRHSRAGGNLIH